jgi:large subunit ribosomal protein L21
MRTKITALLTAAAAAVSAAGAATWAKRRKAPAAPELAVKQPLAATPVRPDPASDPPASGSVPAASSGSAQTDDLTAIKGLGKVKAAKLVAAGITSYAQIAAWSDDDIAEVGLKVNTSPGQIKREDWVGQARALTER